MQKKWIIVIIILFGALFGGGFYLFNALSNNSLANDDKQPVINNDLSITPINQYHFELRSNWTWPQTIKFNNNERGDSLFTILYHHQFPFDHFKSINANTLNKKITTSAQVNLIPLKNFIKQIPAKQVTANMLTEMTIPEVLINKIVGILHTITLDAAHMQAALSAYLSGTYHKYLELLEMMVIY